MSIKIHCKRSGKIHSKLVTVVIFESIGLGGKSGGILTPHSHSFRCTFFVFLLKAIIVQCFGHWKIRERERQLQRQRKRERREKRRERGRDGEICNIAAYNA